MIPLYNNCSLSTLQVRPVRHLIISFFKYDIHSANKGEFCYEARLNVLIFGWSSKVFSPTVIQ